MSSAHSEIALKLSEEPEILLSDPSEPETLDLAIACARTGYDAGSRYLHGLQEQGRAARRGAIVGAMRWTLRVARAKATVLADAGAHADRDPLHAAGLSVDYPLDSGHFRQRRGGRVVEGAPLLRE